MMAELSVHMSVCNTPVFLNPGQHLLMPASANSDTKSPAAKAFTEKLQAAVELAKESWQGAQNRQAAYAMKRRDITPNTCVWS